MENTTCGPDRCRKNAAIFAGSVVTGTPRSLVWVTATSSSVNATVSSEQTGNEANSAVQLARHTLSVCFRSDSDGNRTSVRFDFNCSVINSEVRVLPVPQAMINCPRSADWNPLITLAIASR